MRQDERESLLREDVSRAETARERRQLAAVAEDLSSSPLRGRPLPLRLRNFRPAAEGYLASLGGPLPYMQRLREIDRLTEAHEAALDAELARLGRTEASDDVAESWHRVAAAGTRSRPACRWIPAAATSRSSTAATTGSARSTPSGCWHGFPPRPERQAVRSRAAPRVTATRVQAQRTLHAR